LRVIANGNRGITMVMAIDLPDIGADYWVKCHDGVLLVCWRLDDGSSRIANVVLSRLSGDVMIKGVSKGELTAEEIAAMGEACREW
jgi:hypothetical protein